MKALTRELSLSKTEDHRNFDCPRYEQCLDDASILFFESWSCMNCDGSGPSNEMIRELNWRRKVLARIQVGEIVSYVDRKRVFSKARFAFLSNLGYNKRKKGRNSNENSDDKEQCSEDES